VERLAAVDTLTGLMNRRSFLVAAEKEFARARRYRRPCAVLMLDLDDFKQVNDLHGHPVGDEVLKRCAAAWMASAREQDLIGRLGGEEFCALLPETAEHRVTRMAERLRAATAQLSFAGREPFTVTVSIGTASLLDNDESLAQVIERADSALYRAKQLGRNRVEGAARETGS
jgi:diguanylate cyclase (GGDEF)-like protein